MAEIKGLQKMSLIDYPGKVSCVVFLGGCNFRCPFCHNPDLINPGKLETVPEKEFLEFLKKRRKWLDGVVITGGEPTLQKDLPGFIRKIKDLGYLVCLETNGTNPGVLEELLKGKLLDYLAMDIKAAPERYREAAGTEVDMDKVRRSAGIVRNSGIEHQFRTTFVPGLVGKEDARKIGQWLKGSESYAVQNFRPKNCLDKAFESRVPYSKEGIEEIAGIARKFFRKVEVRE